MRSQPGNHGNRIVAGVPDWSSSWKILASASQMAGLAAILDAAIVLTVSLKLN
jgi:hypothetical protein